MSNNILTIWKLTKLLFFSKRLKSTKMLNFKKTQKQNSKYLTQWGISNMSFTSFISLHVNKISSANKISLWYSSQKGYCCDQLNKEGKQLKVKVRRAYNKRKLGENYQAELKRLSKNLLRAKEMHRKYSWAQYYKMKVTPCRSFIGL